MRRVLSLFALVSIALSASTPAFTPGLSISVRLHGIAPSDPKLDLFRTKLASLKQQQALRDATNDFRGQFTHAIRKLQVLRLADQLVLCYIHSLIHTFWILSS